MPFGVRCEPSRAVVACGRVAGVEDVVGFAPPVVRWVRGGMDALLGSRIATPGFCLARFDARRACGPAVCRSGRRGGAWWLENWIVDASKTRFFLCLCFAVDFESNSIVRFDRFVIIFSVMICRLGIC